MMSIEKTKSFVQVLRNPAFFPVFLKLIRIESNSNVEIR